MTNIVKKKWYLKSGLWAAVGVIAAGLAGAFFDVDADLIAGNVEAIGVAVASIVSAFIASKVD